MNIFHKITLENLKKNRIRTIVTIIGVILSVSMITAVATFVVSLQKYLINGAMEKTGDWHIEITDADSAFVQKQTADSRVANNVTLQNIGYAELEDGRNPAKPYFFISGWNEEALNALPIILLSGRLPENGNEVVIPSHVAANGGVKISVGDTLTLLVGNRMRGNQKLSQNDPYHIGKETFVPMTEKSYKVVGICQRPTIEEYTAPGYTLITTEDITDVNSLSVFITLKNPYQIHSYADSLSGNYSYVFNDVVLRFMGLSGEKMIMILLYSIGAVLITLVMVGSVFLIYNSFYISLNERTHQFGILMSVGATEKQLRDSVLFEGICIGIIGIPIGILVGIPGIQIVLILVSKNFANALYANVPLTLAVSFPSLVAAAGISMITILISAYIPAKKAAGIPVMDCVRQTNEVKVEVEKLKTLKLTNRIYGLEKLLAIKNFKRNKRRYRSIILSLTFSVVLFVSASFFGDHLHQIAKNSSVVAEDYDICFDTRDMKEGELFELYDGMKDVTGVTESSYQALSTYSCSLNIHDLSSHFWRHMACQSVMMERVKQ